MNKPEKCMICCDEGECTHKMIRDFNRKYQWVEKRVKVYATLNGSIAESKGTVTRMRPDGMFYVNLDGRRGEIVAHPKQCRRLRPKKRESYSIHAVDLERVNLHGFSNTVTVYGDRSMFLGKHVMKASNLMRQAKVREFEDLEGTPVEIVFENGILKSWRILEEVL